MVARIFIIKIFIIKIFIHTSYCIIPFNLDKLHRQRPKTLNVDEHPHNKGYNKQKNQHPYFTIFICTEHDISPYMMWSKTNFPVIPPSITPAIITPQLRRTHAKICFCFVFILIYLLNFRLSFLQYYHLIVIKFL